MVHTHKKKKKKKKPMANYFKCTFSPNAPQIKTPALKN